MSRAASATKEKSCRYSGCQVETLTVHEPAEAHSQQHARDERTA
jgi:hypothetical protein